MRRVAMMMVFAAGASAAAQGPGQMTPAQPARQTVAAPERALSPEGTATAMLGGTWGKDAQGNAVYEGGKWLEVVYSRPMLRQRADIFGKGADYGKTVLAGATVWRAGANQTTVFRTEVPLVVDGKALPAGEYGLLVDLKSASEWTLILTSQPRQKAFDAKNKTDLIGATNYDPKHDIVRARMVVNTTSSTRIDQLLIFFSDVTKDSGTLGIAWDATVATVPFTAGK